MLGVLLILWGIACGFVAWSGSSQLAKLASPTFNGDLQDLPIAKFVCEFFLPDNGPVVIAEVAGNAQFTFVVLGFLGFMAVVIGMVVCVFIARRS